MCIRDRPEVTTQMGEINVPEKEKPSRAEDSNIQEMLRIMMEKMDSTNKDMEESSKKMNQELKEEIKSTKEENSKERKEDKQSLKEDLSGINKNICLLYTSSKLVLC